jgi:hypothetical protein
MPAPPLDFPGSFVNTSPESLGGSHNVENTFALVNSNDDYVMMNVADSTGIDLNYDVTITPRVSTAPPLLVNNTAGSALLTVGATGNGSLAGNLTVNGATGLSLTSGNITLPTTYTNAPSANQLGNITAENTNAAVVSLTTAFNSYQGATVSLTPGTWLILSYVSITVTTAGSFYVNITTSTGPTNYVADDVSAQNSFYGAAGATLNTQCMRLVTKTSAGATVYTVGVSAGTAGSGSVAANNCRVKAIRLA